MPFFRSIGQKTIFEARQFRNDSSNYDLLEWINNYAHAIATINNPARYAAIINDVLILPVPGATINVTHGYWILQEERRFVVNAEPVLLANYKPVGDQEGPFCITSDDSGHDYIVPANQKGAFDKWVSDTELGVDTDADFTHCRVNLSSVNFPSYAED